MDDVETATAASARSNKRIQPLDVDLGARIRAARVAAGMSQTALGEVVGVSFQQVQKYELGKDRVSAGALFRLAAALGVPVASFFEGDLHQGSVKSTKSGARDGLSAKIVVLFQRIDDDRVRKQFVLLATALADAQTRGAQEIADEDEA